MPIRTRTAIAAVSLAAIALVAGCSSSKDDASSSTTVAAASSGGSTTKAAFVSAASEICAKGNTQMGSVGSGENGDTLTQGLPGLKEQAQILGDMISQLQALPQPTGADSTTALYPPLEQMTTALDQMVTAAESNDEAAAAKAATQLNTASDQANQVWDAYGITTCGSGSSQQQNQNQQQQNQNQNNQDQQQQQQQQNQ
jgi:hypothetical protein